MNSTHPSNWGITSTFWPLLAFLSLDWLFENDALFRRWLTISSRLCLFLHLENVQDTVQDQLRSDLPYLVTSLSGHTFTFARYKFVKVNNGFGADFNRFGLAHLDLGL